MSVVRRGSAAVVLVAVVGLGGPVSAQETEPELPTGSGCEPDPRICESSVTGEAPTLPRTGPYDRLLATGAVGAGLLLAGGGALVAARRRVG